MRLIRLRIPAFACAGPAMDGADSGCRPQRAQDTLFDC